MSNVRYILIREEDCTACEATGKVDHPLWLAFWADFPDKEPPLEVEERWWRERGYCTSGLPAYNVDCDVCHGLGELRWQVELEEVFKKPASRHNPDGAFAQLMSHYGGRDG